MRLEKHEWIRVGPGKLFGAPFLSRVLLYRLNDIKCSFLVYHDRTAVLSNESGVAIAATSQGLPNINARNVTMAMNIHGPLTISIHYCPTSSSITFEDLAKLPVKRISIKGGISHKNNFDGIKFRIERILIPLSRRRLVGYPGLETKRFIVDSSNYTVAGPVDISDWPEEIPIDKAQMNCWKIRLDNLKSKTGYEVGKSFGWSLTALDVSEEGQVDTVVQMEPDTAATAQV